ncbi:MAG: DUF2934 domain-containing protein [Rhizobiaceae bacterium]
MTEIQEPAARTAEDRIREIAHQIWLEEGCPDGRAEQHWVLAEAVAANANPLPSAAIAAFETSPLYKVA